MPITSLHRSRMITTTTIAITILTTIIMCICYTSPSVSNNSTIALNNDIDRSSPQACKSLTTGEISNSIATLAIHTRIANKQLCINIPTKFTQHHDMERLIASTLIPLGSNRYRTISSSKQRPNSHSIAVKLDGDSLVLTWPHLSWNDIGSSITGEWSPTHGPNPEGSSSKHIQCNQFCDIANRGGLVGATADNNLQLRFTLSKSE